MKFNPTLPLALALTAGLAAAAAAQTTPDQAAPAVAPPASIYSQPQATSTPAQPAYGQTQMQPTTGQAQPSTGQAQPSAAQMPARADQMQQGASPQQPSPSAASSSAATPAPTSTAPGGNESVRNAQQRLQAAGLYNGPTDGVMDPDTRAAIARYQQQNGLQRTESLDEATLARLNGRRSRGRSGGTTDSREVVTWLPSAFLRPSDPRQPARCRRAWFRTRGKSCFPCWWSMTTRC